MAIVSAVPANSQPAEFASATTVPDSVASIPVEVIACWIAQAMKNSSGGETTTGSRPPGRT
jgi:hypothetical protein